ncbi:MAG TPA: ATP-grasp domain-containing protein [Clostridiaceae bacterium]|nr:ATP-grasp domain-containing protein [Clostridiaceae bacterium]
MKKVLVTAIGSFAAEITIRVLKKMNLPVVGCDIYPQHWVANAQEVDVFYQVPYARSADTYIESLLSICRAESVTAIVPLTDDEVDVLSPVREKFKDIGVDLCLSNHKSIVLCRNKAKLTEFLAAQQVCKTIPFQLLSDCDPSALTYPAIVKPLMGRSSQGLTLLTNEKELSGWIAQINPRNLAMFMVQPYIEGTVVAVDVFRDPQRHICQALGRRERLRTLNGAGTTVDVFRNSSLEKQSERLAELLEIRGTVCFEFIENEQGFWFLECNPRFSGGVEFSELAGFPCVQNHLRLFLDRELIQRGEAATMTIARRYQAHITRQ